MKTRVPVASLFAVLVASPGLLCLALFLIASSLEAQTAGQSSLPKKNVGSGSTLEHFTVSNGQLVGRTQAGALAGITIGSGLSLSGTTLTAPVSWSAISGKPSSFPSSIADVTGLQTTLDGKAAASHTQAWSTITDTPTSLIGYGITSFTTDAFKLSTAVDSLAEGEHGLGWVDGRLTMQTPAGALQWYESNGTQIMAWSQRLQAAHLDITSIGLFSAVPATSTSVGEAGMIAYDASYLYICVALNTWKRIPLSSW